MRIVEVRRHSLTKKGEIRAHGSRLSQSRLSQEGVDLARRIGSDAGPFDLVFSSTRSRTAETAIAMGFAIDEEREELDRVPEAVYAVVPHHEQWGWREPFVEYAERIRTSEALAVFAGSQADLWRSLGGRAPDHGSVLVLTHGGTIEPALVACLPDADHGSWGPPFSHCEGVRLVLDGEAFSEIEFLRVAESSRTENA